MQHMQQHLMRPRVCSRSPLITTCGLSARSVQRRRSKLKKQQRKAKQDWQKQIDQKTVRYQVTIPPTDILVSTPPQFFDSEPSYQQQDYTMDDVIPYPPLPPKEQAYWSSSSSSFSDLQQQQQQQHLMQSPVGSDRPSAAPQQNLARQQQQQQRRRQQRQQQSGPGPIKGPEVPPGALWVEDRRSGWEQQQFQRQQRRRHGKQKRQGFSTEELLATSEQVLELRLQGMPGARTRRDSYVAGESDDIYGGRWLLDEAEQQQQQQDQCQVVLSTDILWQQLHDIQRAQVA